MWVVLAALLVALALPAGAAASRHHHHASAADKNGGGFSSDPPPPITTPPPAATGPVATLTPTGQAAAPAGAPPAVAAIIAAGNQIASLPYRYGGGHASFRDTAYDCSGSVSFALHGALLLPAPDDSSDLEGFQLPGPGQWVTIYANGGHVFMTVAGLRFDTSGATQAGSRWQADMRPARGYVVSHPTGL